MRQHSIGERFGDYTLVRPLGEGGFANVYLGQEVHSDYTACHTCTVSSSEPEAMREPSGDHPSVLTDEFLTA